MPVVDITPEEIAAECERIRAEWTPEERWIRSGYLDWEAYCQMKDQRRGRDRVTRRQRRERRRAAIRSLMAKLERKRLTSFEQ